MDTYTLDDVLQKIILVQDMKLLFLQGITRRGKDIIIHHIVNRNSLIKVIQKYSHHFDDVMAFPHGSITIFNLSHLSFLRVGLQKQVIRFIEPYMPKKNHRLITNIAAG